MSPFRVYIVALARAARVLESMYAPANERDDVKGEAAYCRADVTAGNKGQAVH